MDNAFEDDGFRHFPRALDDAALAQLESLLGTPHGPGVRIGAEQLVPIAGLLSDDGPVAAIAKTLIGQPAFPVRAILFDKSNSANWSLGWHQDRTICVAERIDLEGFGPWTVKQGQLHTQPPQTLLERMVTLRMHLDDVPADNGPLLVIQGSHRLGRLAEAEIQQLIAASAPAIHLARRGDVWAYRTPIIHASAASSSRHRARRVLQLDYAAEDLPGGLRWTFNV